MSDKGKTVITLGYFDSVHIGHRKVFKSARKLADDYDARLTVFTFEGNLKSVTQNSKDKVIYTDLERENIYKKLGADNVEFCKVSKEFLSMDKLEYLTLINKKFDVIGYVTGSDYRFGKNRCGDVEFIKKYAEDHGQFLHVVPEVKTNGEKVSTSQIKELLKNGNIEKANSLLGENYTVTGKVVKDRGVGKDLGYPTANVIIDAEKHKLKSGVYQGKVRTGNGEFKAVINYGPRPTFDLEEVVVEAHLIGFKDDLYGKTIVVEFEKFLREVIKFASVEDLKNQLEKDVTEVKNNG